MNNSSSQNNGADIANKSLVFTPEGRGKPAVENASMKLDLVLIDLCSAFASANGMKPEFYYKAGQEIIARDLVSIDNTRGVIVCANEDMLYELLMELRHPRGQYVARLVANRISRFFDQVNEQGGVLFLEELLEANSSTAEKMLLPLFGVGPSFVEVFLLLSGLNDSGQNVD